VKPVNADKSPVTSIQVPQRLLCRTKSVGRALLIMKTWKLSTTWLVAAAMGLVACATQTGQDTAPTSTSTTAAATTVAAVRTDFPPSGPVEPGTYDVAPSTWNAVGFTVTMPEGWDTQFGPGTARKHADEEREMNFYFVIVDAIYSDPCKGEGELIEVGPSVDDLANALLDQPFTVASEPIDVTLGGLPARQMELTVPDDLAAEDCRGGENLQVWYSETADKYLLFGDGKATVYIFDVNGERQVFYTQQGSESTAADLSELQAIVESIKIDP